MTVQSAVDADLPFLRREAEELFTDVFELRNYGDGWHYDVTAGKDVRAFTLRYVARGKVVSKTVSSESQAGDRTVTAVDRELHLPHNSPGVPVGTVAYRRRDGVEFRVLADVTHAQPKTRRLQVEETLS